MAINEQMQKVDKETLEQAVNVYTSKVYSSIDVEIIRDGMKNISDYRYVGEASFPQENMRQKELTRDEKKIFNYFNNISDGYNNDIM